MTWSMQKWLGSDPLVVEIRSNAHGYARYHADGFITTKGAIPSSVLEQLLLEGPRVLNRRRLLDFNEITFTPWKTEVEHVAVGSDPRAGLFVHALKDLPGFRWSIYREGHTLGWGVSGSQDAAETEAENRAMELGATIPWR